MRVTVWGEGFLDVDSVAPEERPLNYANYVNDARRIYPEDVHVALADVISAQLGALAKVRTSTFDDHGLGLSDEVLDETDVLVWWGHVKQHAVPDDAVERVWRRIVRDGMGLIVLHAGSDSKIFKRLMGTSCGVGWIRQGDDWEAVWTLAPGHRIAHGVPSVFVIPAEEMYCEYFDIPVPDELVFVSTFKGGEVFRSGCCFERGNGRVFYFRPGHESHPTYYLPEIRTILGNAVEWAAERPEVGAELWTIGEVSESDVAAHLAPEGWFQDRNS